MWHTLKDADGSGVVVDTSCSAESGREDRGGGDQVVGKGVVQVALGGGGVSVSLVAEVGGRGGGGRHTWSSKTSWTVSNSFSYLSARNTC